MPSDKPIHDAAPPSPWTAVTAPPPPPVSAPVRHSYPLTVRNHGLGTAIGLLLRSTPYALAHCGVLLVYALGCIIWLVITFGGAAWLGAHIAEAFGIVWFILCLVGIGWFWGAVLRYLLHLLACGHVVVLTDLITRGQVAANAGELQLAYGKRVVTERFGQVNALYGLNMLVRGILQVFHRTLDWIGEMLPIPGLESLSNLVNIVMRAATRYLDKVILSYNLARNDQDPGRGAREGIVYYCQNARPILQDLDLDRYSGTGAELPAVAGPAGTGRGNHGAAAACGARVRRRRHHHHRAAAGRRAARSHSSSRCS